MRQIKCNHSTTSEKRHHRKCYANAFFNLPAQSDAPVIRTFTQDELIQPSAECLSIPLTNSCSASLLQLGKCKSPADKWCKIVDRENKFVTSIQVPKCCGGCYNFDLSASVSLIADITLTVGFQPPITVTSTEQPVPAVVDLKLCEQLPRQICIADEVSQTPYTCFTAETFPIIDSPQAVATLQSGAISIIDILTVLITSVTTNQPISIQPAPIPNNISVSGLVCLKGCERIVPCLTIRNLTALQNISSILGVSFATPFIDLLFTNIRLQLHSLSLKLVRIGDCPKDCKCKLKNR